TGGFPMAISGDAKVLALASQRGNSSVTIIDTATGKEQKTLGQNDLFKDNLNFNQPTLSLSDDGKILLITSNSRSGEQLPLLWVDTTTGQRLHEIAPPMNSRFAGGQLSRDGRQAAGVEMTSDGKSFLRVYDTRTGKETHAVELPAGGGGNNPMVFELRPDGKTLVASSGNRPMRLYDYTAGKELEDVRGLADAGPFVIFALSRDGKELFVGNNGKVHHWDVDAGKEVRQWDAPALLTRDDARFGIGPGNLSRVRALALSDDGRSLVVCGSQSFTVFDARSGKQRSNGGGSGAAVNSVRFAPDGKGLYVGGSDQGLHPWDAKHAKHLKELPRFNVEAMARGRDFDFFSNFLGGIGFSADGKLLAMSLGEKGVGVWNAETGTAVKRYGGEPDKDPGPDI